VFRNVRIENTDAGELHRRLYTTFRTRRKIEIWNNQIFNLLKSTGKVMHHQFNIQQLYALPTLYLCVLYLSENKERLVPLIA